MTTADAIKSQLDIATVVAHYVKLKRNGSRMVGLCPFHTEKTASFGVKIGDQFFKCFGCDAKGDVIRFVQEIEGISFTAAVAVLVERYGVTLPDSGNSSPGPTYSEADVKLARLWQHGMALWIESHLAWMKARVNDSDFEMQNSPKAAMIQFYTRKAAALAEMSRGELVAEYLQAKRADARRADYCIQRARNNVVWWRNWQRFIVLLQTQPHPGDADAALYYSEGLDPDEFIRKYGADLFRRMIYNAAPWCFWLAARANTADTEQIATVGIRHIHDEIDRPHFVREVLEYICGSAMKRTHAA